VRPVRRVGRADTPARPDLAAAQGGSPQTQEGQGQEQAMTRRDTGTHHRGLLAGFSPLAGVSAGTAAVLFAFGVLALAWHRVAGQVSTGITVLVYVVITVVGGLALAALAYAVLWLRHRVRHPETLAPRQQVRAEVVEPESPQVIAASAPAAIERPRIYLNVTDDQLAALMRHHAEGK
jgi:apolipoprotein N-acyltransferase